MDKVAKGTLMEDLRRGDQDAARELVDAFYPELRRLAASRMRNEKPDHTWQPTALVHEVYLELTRLRGLNERSYEQEQEKAAFLNLAGAMMRRLLIHHARPLYRRSEKVEFDSSHDAKVNGIEALVDVENALERLGAVDPKLQSVVLMRVFEGLTGEEIAARLGCSPRTVANYWDVARHWLHKEWAVAPTV
jgi:RNA polymerase sigma factor (TIGR02999 family)